MKTVKKVQRRTLKKKIQELVNGWECLEDKLSQLPETHPMRLAVPAIRTCREQLDSTIKGKAIPGMEFKVE